ncbi:ATP-binding cassette domain-containing protein [Nocardia farcinica]|uniref:ATP-binding cassette domain-containing protein n=1 Tax=Nocardia farcinica TaxID=37329 RepID=UPI002458380E|nr:ATP-binding cassette domain-containing protein [Nocardia farcinica]
MWLTLRANKVTSAYLKRAQHNSDEASNLLGNVLTNLVSLRVFRGIDWVVAANDRYFRRSRQGWTDFYRRRVGFGARQGVLIVVQYVAVFGLLLWREGTAQLAQVVVLVMVLSQLNRPFELIATALREFAVARSMAAPLQDLLDAHAPVPRVGRARVPRDRAFDIVLDDVGYRYRSDAAPTVAGVRAAIEPGRLTFVVGPSGAGKSTLLGILLGTHPGYTGSVRVAGAELADLDLEDYWRLVGYVPQDPMMMNASLRDNVLFGRPGTDAEVLEALRAVELGGGWLAELDGGLDYRIGERGSLLSGGERQRLALARALIGAPRLLLLDEPSSALDEQTERSIFERLRAAGREMTIVAVTHRTGLVRDGDHVIRCGAPVAEPALPR